MAYGDAYPDYPVRAWLPLRLQSMCDHLLMMTLTLPVCPCLYSLFWSSLLEVLTMGQQQTLNWASSSTVETTNTKFSNLVIVFGNNLSGLI